MIKLINRLIGMILIREIIKVIGKSQLIILVTKIMMGSE